MNIKFKHICAMLVAAATLPSCYEDKGNYD